MYVCMYDKIQLPVPIYQVELTFDTSSRSVSHMVVTLMSYLPISLYGGPTT